MTADNKSAAGLLLKRWWIVIGGALIIALVTFGISKAVPATYSSSADVSVLVSGTDANATSLGANNLASQFAQVVKATDVLQTASNTLKSHVPSSAITGGTVGAQNLISIQATGSSAAIAQARAAAVTSAFILYIEHQVSNQTVNYQQTSTAQLAPLTKQIAETQARLATIPASAGTTPSTLALEQTLDTLIAQRAAALSSIAETAVAGHPSVRLVSAAGGGSQIAPKPTLYALIAFILGLLIVARLVVYFGPRRSSQV